MNGLFIISCLVLLLDQYNKADGAITAIGQAAGARVSVTTALAGNVAADSTVLTLPENVATPITTFTLTGAIGAITWSSSSNELQVTGTPTGTVSVAAGKTLDYETSTTITSVITAVDSTVAGSLTATVSLTLHLTDLNDNAPIFSLARYDTAVADGSTAGTVATTVTATDADGTAANNVITYSIAGGNVNNDWTIQPSTGVITVAPSKSIVRSVTHSYALVVLATDSGTSHLTGTTTVSITAGGGFVAVNVILTLAVILIKLL